ncbi:hypothetical protein O9993_17085 [Vibrio lentus]|nr:hypothetical protein [Vibrio lentus]
MFTAGTWKMFWMWVAMITRPKKAIKTTDGIPLEVPLRSEDVALSEQGGRTVYGDEMAVIFRLVFNNCLAWEQINCSNHLVTPTGWRW